MAFAQKRPFDVNAMMELKRVFRRPHYRVRDGALYFLASTRPVTTVSNEELATWEALATGDSRESLRRRVGPGADAAIARFPSSVSATKWVPSRPDGGGQSSSNLTATTLRSASAEPCGSVATSWSSTS